MKTCGTTTRRATAGAAIALAVGLAGCNVNLEGDVSVVNISRTCEGDPDHHSQWDHWTQVFVTVSPEVTEDHNILVSFNDGASTAGQANVGPGSGLGVLSDLNVTEIDVAVVPTDATGDFDTYHQVFNPC